MKTSSLRLPRSLTMIAAAVAASTALVITGCSSGTSSSKGNPEDYQPKVTALSDQKTKEILSTAFYDNTVTADSLDPIVVRGLKEIGQDYSPEAQSKALACLGQATCKIGDGKQTLAILDGNGQDLWRKITRAAIILQATAYPNIGSVMYLQAGGNLQTMQSQLQTLISKRVTGIVTYDDFGAAMTASYKRATDAGIPVVAYGGTPGPDAESAVVSQVQSDFCDDGNRMAEATKQMIGANGNVAFFTGTPGNPQGEGWQKCASDWFAKNAPGIKVVNKSNTSWTEAGATAAATALISSGKNVDAILNDYNRQTPNIVEAYKRARSTVPAQITWTFENSALKMWEDDAKANRGWKLAYSSSINFEGNVALSALMAHLAGEKVAPQLRFPLPFVQAQMGAYRANEPANSPGPTVLPADFLAKVLS